MRTSQLLLAWDEFTVFASVKRDLWSAWKLSPLLVLFLASAALARDKYTCEAPHPENMCNAGNTCGSDSTSCNINIKRSGESSAYAEPSIPNVKANAPFCVQTGTTVVWGSSSKDVGFVIDFGPSSPFATAGAIIGGTDRHVSVVARTRGCFKYSVGACTAGTIYGMCGSSDAEIVVTGPGKK